MIWLFGFEKKIVFGGEEAFFGDFFNFEETLDSQVNNGGGKIFLINFFINDSAGFGRRKAYDFSMNGGEVFVGKKREDFFLFAFVEDRISLVLEVTAGHIPVAKEKGKDKERDKIKKVVLKKDEDFLESSREGKDSFFNANDNG